MGIIANYIKRKNEEAIEGFKMCGPCLFGEAACIDPEDW